MVHPSSGQPRLPPGVSIPEELQQYFDLCGGLELFLDAEYPSTVYGPASFVQAHPVLLAPLTLSEIESNIPRSEPSWNWHLIADAGTQNESVVVHVDGPHAGRCYSGFWETYPQDSPVLARSFATFLHALVMDEGQTHWEELFGKAMN